MNNVAWDVMIIKYEALLQRTYSVVGEDKIVRECVCVCVCIRDEVPFL